MKHPGLDVSLVGERVVIPLTAVSRVEDLRGEFDFGLVTLKAPFIAPALEPLVARGGVRDFVSLGNGLIQEGIARIVGAERLLIGTVSWGATNHGPGRVSQTTIAPFSLGELDGSMSDRLTSLGDVLSDVAEVHYTDNIQGQVWAKLLLNSTFSGLSVATGLVYGDVMSLPNGPTVAMALWTEGFQIACARGLSLDVVAGVHPRDIAVLSPADVSTSRSAIERLMVSLGPTKASMLQDVEKGGKTEVDVINGGVGAAARQLGVPSPMNDAIVQMVHSFEHGSVKPSIQHLESLVALGRTLLPAN